MNSLVPDAPMAPPPPQSGATAHTAGLAAGGPASVVSTEPSSAGVRTPRFHWAHKPSAGHDIAPFDASAFAWAAPDDLLLFAYGSLIWNPGFPFVERTPALLRGWHRRACIMSIRYRGTKEQPGVVLGLDRGGACRGMVFRIAGADVPDVLPYLWDREMMSNAYRPTRVTLTPLSGDVSARDGLRPGSGRMRAVTFIARRGHPQYCGGIDRAQLCRMIREASGCAGSCVEYLHNTAGHLEQAGIPDRRLERLIRDAADCAAR